MNAAQMKAPVTTSASAMMKTVTVGNRELAANNIGMEFMRLPP